MFYFEGFSRKCVVFIFLTFGACRRRGSLLLFHLIGTEEKELLTGAAGYIVFLYQLSNCSCIWWWLKAVYIFSVEGSRREWEAGEICRDFFFFLFPEAPGANRAESCCRGRSCAASGSSLGAGREKLAVSSACCLRSNTTAPRQGS